MANIQFVVRSLSNAKKSLKPNYCMLQRLYCSKSDKPEDEEAQKNKTNDEAIKKLNSLLRQMVESDTKVKLDLAKPGNKKALRQEAGTKSIKNEPVEKTIVKAVKNVAESMGGNVKQTESELLSKLLNPVKEDLEKPAASLSDIVKGMKIDRETKSPVSVSRADQVKQLLDKTRHQSNGPRGAPRQRRPVKHEVAVHSEPIDLFGEEPLGIFTSPLETYQEKENSMWTTLEDRELRLAVTQPPSNYFQEMILWTEQGKLWKFPIDNEQGMEEENNVYFADHVFMERHLEPWCPHKGPVRHFMELVCVGLSKNPYMTVKEKTDHIEWYKNYFEDKMKLLKEIGAVASDTKIPQKQIDA
ncbi:PREDICTED: 28S ribosomal protein S31, mitochondrial [Nicrophorus vespilloides]|uniref:Small ribosomal subunit protein mS31 n=1 Tax=Nicrophorus vespilloides TaxID=110193 RepID=A0ABM1MCT4_NICVS|nr:PREDICTED: 28S ribosomal protein S31, mitochondrial [Nicrophorus vespilloides]